MTTPQHEEAARLLRLAGRDQAALAALLGAPGVAPAVAFFHAQQAVEKALKAVMCLRALEYRRTHDLEELAGQLADAGHPPSVAETDLRRLTPYAVEYRYDDEAPELLTAEQAQAIVAAVLAWSQAQLQAPA
jgi:HEPN domain-containing protein